MKEIEKLIEAAKRVIGNGECPFNSAGCVDCDKCLITDMEHRVAAAEAMLKHAKVFEGNLNYDKGIEDVIYPSAELDCDSWFDYIKNNDGKRVRIIVIPTEEDDAGK